MNYIIYKLVTSTYKNGIFLGKIFNNIYSKSISVSPVKLQTNQFNLYVIVIKNYNY